MLLVHRDSSGAVTSMPFAYKSGEMMAIVEEVADYIAGMELVDSLWENVAADRLRVILQQRMEIQELRNTIELGKFYAEAG